MAVGKHEPKEAHNRLWQDAVAITLDEAATALEESIHDLTDEQVWARPLEERHSIGTMVMHCLADLNGCACWVRIDEGVRMVADEDWFNVSSNSPAELDARQKGVERGGVEQMVRWIGEVREGASEGVAAASEDEVRGDRAGSDWCKRTRHPAADAYMRTICHTIAHTRQIWALRGAMGAIGQDAWAEQHYARWARHKRSTSPPSSTLLRHPGQFGRRHTARSPRRPAGEPGTLRTVDRLGLR